MTQDTDSTGGDASTTGDVSPAATAAAATVATKDQIRMVGDALLADAERAVGKLGKLIKPGDWELLERVAARAVKLKIDAAGVPEDDAKRGKALAARKAQVDAQLDNVKAFATGEGKAAFWDSVERVVLKLGTFAIGAILSG